MKLDDPASIVVSAVGRLPVILFAFDRDERFVMSEGGGLAGLGRRPGQVVGMTLAEVYGTTPAIVDAVRRALRGESVELSVVLGSATYQATYQPLLDEGEIQGAVGVAFDITERQRTEQLFRSVIQESTDAVVIAARDGRILRFNPAAERMFQQSEGDLLGESLTRLMPLEYRAPHTEGMARHAFSGEARVLGRWVRVQGLRADGTTFPLDLHVNEILRDSNPVFVGVLRDASQDEALQRMRENLIASMSHEFRTPLAAIAMFSDLVRTSPGLPGAITEYLDVIDRNVGRLKRLVEDLLLLGGTGDEQLQAIRETVDISALIGEAVASARPAAAAAGISLRWDPIPGPALFGDAVRLGEVFDNLLGNAIKYTPAGGSIRVTAQAHEDAWSVVVTNSASHLRPEEVAAVFEPLVRGANAVASGVPGTGMGLAIARAIVERHGGTIEFSSTPRKGTTVTVMLPFEPDRKTRQADE